MSKVRDFLDSCAGSEGLVQSKYFNSLVTALDDLKAEVIKEVEEPGLVKTVYKVGDKFYTLVYGTRKPTSPKGAVLLFSFYHGDRIK